MRSTEFKIDILSAQQMLTCSTFFECDPNGMFYHIPEWMRLISSMTGCTVEYLVSYDKYNTINGVMPLCVKEGFLGKIVNSSAYFGSHGGIVSSIQDVQVGLAEFFGEYAKENNIVAANIIEPLFADHQHLYENTLPVVQKDFRIGQYKDLSGLKGHEDLFQSLSGIVRSNLKRKSWRAGLEIYRQETKEGLEKLAQLHYLEMSSKPGGNPKKDLFFEQIAQQLEAGKQWRLYFGKLENEVVAGLLLFYWRDYVEYITPVYDSKFANYQPSSALMFQAMLDAISDGYKIWNFGGTWPSQNGVRKFKESWGASNRNYQYYIIDFCGLDGIKMTDSSKLMKDYEGFYLYPF